MGKKQRRYDHTEAELLFSDYAERKGLAAAAPLHRNLVALTEELTEIAATLGIEIEDMRDPSAPGVYVVSVEKRAKAKIELRGGEGIIVTNGGAPVKADIFWNPFAARFESRELDEAGRRTDALTVLARAVIQAVEKG